jgi:hypothetical protein
MENTSCVLAFLVLLYLKYLTDKKPCYVVSSSIDVRRKPISASIFNFFKKVKKVPQNVVSDEKTVSVSSACNLSNCNNISLGSSNSLDLTLSYRVKKSGV